MFLKFLYIGAIVLGWGAFEADDDRVARAIAILKAPAISAREYHEVTARHDAIETLRTSSIDPASVMALVGDIIEDRRNPTRRQVLALACDVVTEDTLDSLLDSIRRFAGGIITNRPYERPRFVDSRVEDYVLLSEVFEDEIPRIAAKTADKGRILDLIYDLLMLGDPIARDHRIVTMLFRSISEVDIPTDLRRQFGLRIAADYQGGVGPIAWSFLDPAMIPSLRRVLRNAVIDRRGFPFLAASYLVEKGDMESLPDLIILEKEMLNQPVLSPDRLAGTLSWKLRVQDSTDEMLSWLAKPVSDDPTASVSTGDRIWLMHKCVQASVDKESVRNALLEFTSTVPPDDRLSMIGLSRLWDEAVKIGIRNRR